MLCLDLEALLCQHARSSVSCQLPSTILIPLPHGAPGNRSMWMHFVCAVPPPGLLGLHQKLLACSELEGESGTNEDLKTKKKRA